MNVIHTIKKEFLGGIRELFGVSQDFFDSVDFTLNIDKDKSFGDFSSNVSMVLAKKLKKNPRNLANDIVNYFEDENNLKKYSYLNSFLESINIAGPGFLNISLKDVFWRNLALDLFIKKQDLFKLDASEKKLKYNIEFVSANPTGPLHLGHGRGGIIGDVLAGVLNFLGHDATREFYINDAGSQIQKLGNSFKVRCEQELGQDVKMPEECYAGDYLVDYTIILF